MRYIYIVGLGAGNANQLSVAVWRILKRGKPLFLQTSKHPAARQLMREGKTFTSFDQIRGNYGYRRIACRLLHSAGKYGKAYYALPGHLVGGDRAVSLLRRWEARLNYRLVFIPSHAGDALNGLEKIMEQLRKNCPWDRRQTHYSLRPYMLEEAYEAIAAIESGDPDLLKEELGDVLLQVVFHSELAREQGRFNLNDVISGVSAKLIRRHPHVFGKERYRTVSQVMQTWQQIKASEKKQDTSRLFGVDAGLPALSRAAKIQKRAAEKGFDWPEFTGAMDKLKEELLELENAYRQGAQGNIEEELGDVLFAAVNVARFLKVDPELALEKSLRKFVERFAYIERQVKLSGQGFDKFSLEELDRWWEEAKNMQPARKKKL